MFSDNKNYRKIVECLSAQRYGATRAQISEITEISDGGTLSDMLKALVKSDIISCYYNFGETKRNLYYKLTDMIARILPSLTVGAGLLLKMSVSFIRNRYAMPWESPEYRLKYSRGKHPATKKHQELK